MPDLRRYLICYDIANTKKRNRVVEAVKDFGGVRLQKSVFECPLNETRLRDLSSKLGTIIDKKTDSIFFTYLCESCRQKRTTLGDITFPRDVEVLIL